MTLSNRLKRITVRCKECNKDFKCYGRYDSTIPNCKVHTDRDQNYVWMRGTYFTSHNITAEGNGCEDKGQVTAYRVSCIINQWHISILATYYK